MKRTFDIKIDGRPAVAELFYAEDWHNGHKAKHYALEACLSAKMRPLSASDLARILGNDKDSTLWGEFISLDTLFIAYKDKALIIHNILTPKLIKNAHNASTETWFDEYASMANDQTIWLLSKAEVKAVSDIKFKPADAKKLRFFHALFGGKENAKLFFDTFSERYHDTEYYCSIHLGWFDCTTPRVRLLSSASNHGMHDCDSLCNGPVAFIGVKDPTTLPYALPVNMLPSKLGIYGSKLAKFMELAEKEAEKRYPAEGSDGFWTFLHMIGVIIFVQLPLCVIQLKLSYLYLALSLVVAISYVIYAVRCTEKIRKKKEIADTYRRAFIASALLNPESLSLKSIQDAHKQLAEAESEADDDDDFFAHMVEAQEEQKLLEEAREELEGERDESGIHSTE